MNIFNLETPEGGIYISTVLLLLLGACLALPLHVLSVRKRTRGASEQGPRMPWWGVIVFVLPYLTPLIPGSDKWIVPKGLAYSIIGFGFILGGLLAILAFVGLLVSVARLVL